MPSDCQCSACGACDCQTTKVVEKRVGDADAIKMIEELEEKIRILEEKNGTLLKENKRKKVDKDEIIRELLKKLSDLTE